MYSGAFVLYAGVVNGTHAGPHVFVKCKVFEHRRSGVQGGLASDGAQ